MEIALFQNSLSWGLTHAQSEVNSCFDLLHFLGAQGGKPIAKTVFGYGGNCIQVSNAVLGHDIITLNSKNCGRASPTCYSDQSLVTVGRLMRQTRLMAGNWDRSKITRLHAAAMR